jgi:hypothetical protein
MHGHTQIHADAHTHTHTHTHTHIFAQEIKFNFFEVLVTDTKNSKIGRKHLQPSPPVM